MSFGDAILPPVAVGPPPSTGNAVIDAANGVTAVINAWYGTKANIATAKANAAIAEAQGRAAYTTATIGLPSPSVLLLGGGALLAVFLLAGGRGRR